MKQRKPNNTQNRSLRSNFRPYELISSVYLILMCSVYLLIFDQTGLSGLSYAKRTCFYLIGGGYPAMMLLYTGFALCIGDVRWQELKQKLTPHSAAVWMMLAYLLLTVISALCSDFRDSTWLGYSRREGVLTIAIYVVDFYLLSVFARPHRGLVYLLAGTTTLFCLVCILQMFGYNPLSLYTQDQSFAQIGGTHVGTIGNVGHVGGFLCLAIPLFACFLLRQTESVRFSLLLPLLLLLYVLWRINVLAAFVGLSAGLLLALPAVLRLKKRALWIWYGGLAVLGVLSCLLLFFVDFGQGFFHELHELLHGRAEASFGSGRFWIWRQVLAHVPRRLWFGYGPDTMGLVGLEPFSRFDETLGRPVQAFIDTAHNEPLNILFHQGIFALLAYLGALLFSIRGFFRRARSSAAAAMLGTAVICYLIQSLFGISQLIVAPYFWICLGLLESTGRNETVPAQGKR